MTATDRVDPLVRALGADLGTPLRLGAQGQTTMTFAGGMVCTLAVLDEQGQVALGAVVAGAPATGRAGLLATALRLNEGEAGGGGGGIGLDEQRGELVLWRRRAAEGLDKARLALFLAEFMDAAVAARDRLREAAAGSAVETPAREPTDGAVDLDLLRYVAIRG